MSDCVICKDKFGYPATTTGPESVDFRFINSSDGSLKVATTKCGHLFHLNCILNWLQVSGSQCKCPICNKKVTRVSLTLIFHDWSDGDKNPGYNANKIELLENEKTSLSQKLLQSNRELDKLRKDLQDLRKNLKSKLKEKSDHVIKLQTELEKLKSTQSSPTTYKRKKIDEVSDTPNSKRNTHAGSSRRSLISNTEPEPEPDSVTSTFYSNTLHNSRSSDDLSQTYNERWNSSFYNYINNFMNHYETPASSFIRSNGFPYPGTSGVVDLVYSSSVSPLPIIDESEHHDPPVYDLTLD